MAETMDLLKGNPKGLLNNLSTFSKVKYYKNPMSDHIITVYSIRSVFLMELCFNITIYVFNKQLIKNNSPLQNVSALS